MTVEKHLLKKEQGSTNFQLPFVTWCGEKVCQLSIGYIRLKQRSSKKKLEADCRKQGGRDSDLIQN